MFGDAGDFFLGDVARGGEAPRALDEGADAEAEGVVVGDPLHASFSRRDGLRATVADPHVGVVGAGAFGFIDGEERELLEGGVGGVDDAVAEAGGGDESSTDRLRGEVRSDTDRGSSE